MIATQKHFQPFQALYQKSKHFTNFENTTLNSKLLQEFPASYKPYTFSLTLDQNFIGQKNKFSGICVYCGI